VSQPSRASLAIRQIRRNTPHRKPARRGTGGITRCQATTAARNGGSVRGCHPVLHLVGSLAAALITQRTSEQQTVCSCSCGRKVNFRYCRSPGGRPSAGLAVLRNGALAGVIAQLLELIANVRWRRRTSRAACRHPLRRRRWTERACPLSVDRAAPDMARKR
jgi:hypothetical protein